MGRAGPAEAGEDEEGQGGLEGAVGRGRRRTQESAQAGPIGYPGDDVEERHQDAEDRVRERNVAQDGVLVPVWRGLFQKCWRTGQ